ncbi:MAG: choice-of-anchor L domain-containing protein, partial [Polyangiaceae bacterium]
AACSGSQNGSGFGSANDGTGNGSGDGGLGSGTGLGGSGDGGAGSGVCAPNPANYDIPGNNCDDDDDGTIDNVPSCDTGLAKTGSADDFVKALGVCQTADATHWGVVSAAYTNGYGTTAAPADTQHAINPKFGSTITPREGATLGVLSTGYAGEYDNATNKSGSTGKFKSNSAGYGEQGAVPPGFPKAAGACPIDTKVNDVMDVKLQIQAPANAQGVQFDFDFYSGEWPDFICSKFNDGFIAFLSSSAFNGGAPDNMSFDSLNNPVSVNNGFFDRCTAGIELGCASCLTLTKYSCPSIGTSTCAAGTGELDGTGFGAPTGQYSATCTDGSTATSSAGGATGWLTSQAPVKGGETITIEFMIWNTGDEKYDSSVLLDHLTWVPGATVTGTNRPR